MYTGDYKEHHVHSWVVLNLHQNDIIYIDVTML